MRKSFRRFLNMIEVYYSKDQKRIASENIRNLEFSAAVGACLCMVYFFYTFLPIVEWSINRIHIGLFCVNVFFFFAALLQMKFRWKNNLLITIETMLYIALQYACFLGISIYPYENKPDVFFCAWMMIIPVLFSIRPLLLSIESGLAVIIYILAVVNIKEIQTVWHDMFAIIFEGILALVIMYEMTQNRIKSYYNEVRLLNLSQTDKLTKVYNKVSFEELCKELCIEPIQKVKRCLMIIDIDDFKRINDQYGHKTGDEVIRSVGLALADVTLDSDIVGRIGGDEFAVLFSDISSEAEIRKMDRAIRKTVLGFTSEFVSHGVSISVGAVLLQKESHHYVEVYEMADKALYTSKSLGKNTITVNQMRSFEPSSLESI